MVTPKRGSDLSRFRYHTGATLRPVGEDEPCPLLFRDLGPAGMLRFLSGGLKRLAGPMAPILYMRSAAYVEPYADYEEIGRLAILRPRLLAPWFSGVPEVYVAEAGLVPDADFMVCAPTEWSVGEGARALEGASDARAVREALGGRLYDERLANLAASLRQLNAGMEASERLARPVRRALQTGTLAAREALRDDMARRGVSERDLCSAWHHIPRDRRDALNDWLRSREGGTPR